MTEIYLAINPVFTTQNNHVIVVQTCVDVTT